MPNQTVTLTLPDHIYNQLAAQAQVKGSTFEEFASLTLARQLPPQVEDDLPGAMRVELEALTHLSDDALWQIAGSTMNEDKIALYDVLLERNKAGNLTLEGRALLAELRTEADALMLRKAHAYAILQSRGRQLPTLDELHSQTL